MQLDRTLEIAAFLDQHQWGEAVAEPVAADFSPRRYARLTQADGRTAILMDADVTQRTPQFVGVANILRKLKVNAPEIYAADAGRGLVLMQDFGTRNVGRLLDQGEGAEEYFLRAAEILAHIHGRFERTDVTGLDMFSYTADLFAHQAELFLDIYFPAQTKGEASEADRQDFCAAWRAVLGPLETLPKSLLLRDYMPDNLMALPDDKLGVLDFELAGIGCVAYDLSSLCEEARRDGAFSLLPKVIGRYREVLSQTDNAVLPHADLMRACTIFSAQRHTRHLGNMARMALQKGMQDKLAFIPRIRKHLRHILNEPYLFPVKEWMERFEGLIE